MRKLSFFSLALAATLFVVGCKKGDTGPQGTAGTNGTNGTNGSNGANGTNGKDGNANVMYSGWMGARFTAYTLKSKPMDSAKFVVPALTDSLLAISDIKVYMKEVIGTRQTQANPAINIYSLPFVKDTAYVNAVFSKGIITIDGNMDLTVKVDTWSKMETNLFRYVIIPGGTKVNAKINWNNYSEVARYLNIEN